jgi:hypothetical protein
LGATSQALAYYERAIECDPTLTRALEDAADLRRSIGDHDGLERLLKMQLEQAKAAGDRTKLTAVLDQMGELYRKFLKEPELAIDAYEAAQAFDADNRGRAEVLAELYASDPKQYLDKAVKAQAHILRKNPYRAESYKLLRRLYTDAKQADAAWCLCQALNVLNLAEPDEERFYKRHRSETAAPAQAALTAEDWSLLVHPELDPIVTRLFAVLQPTILKARTQPIEALGYDTRYVLDIARHGAAVSQTLAYGQGVFGFAAPPVYQNTNDEGGLGFIHARTPAMLLGRAALESNEQPQGLAFAVGRHLAFFQPGHYVRHLVPTGTGLKAWLFAAIKMSVPAFPVSTEVQGPVEEAMVALRTDFQGVERDKLASLVAKLLKNGGALDLKKWVAMVDASADRAGFLLAHDLGTASEIVRLADEGAIGKERAKELLLFSVSEEYFTLRRRLGVTVD